MARPSHDELMRPGRSWNSVWKLDAGSGLPGSPARRRTASSSVPGLTGPRPARTRIGIRMSSGRGAGMVSRFGVACWRCDSNANRSRH